MRAIKEKFKANSEYLHILVLFNFAFAQPIYSLLGSNPEFFVIRAHKPIDVFVLCLILSIIGPLLIVGIQVVIKRFLPRVYQGTHLLLVAFFTLVFALRAFRLINLPAPLLTIVIACLLGISAAILYWRYRTIKLFLTYLAPAIIIFPLLFCFNTPVKKFLFESDEQVFNKTLPNLEPTDQNTPIFLIIFDEFPLVSLLDEKQLIDPIRFPSFSRFSKNATWYRQATTVNSTTHHSIPAIISGLYPTHPKLPRFASYPHNLFTLLYSLGYNFHVHETGTQFCAPKICPSTSATLLKRFKSLEYDFKAILPHLYLPLEYSKNMPDVTRTWMNFNPDGSSALSERKAFLFLRNRSKFQKKSRDEIAHEFFSEINPNRPKTFHYMHLILPHSPFHFFPSGKKYRQYNVVPGLNGGTWGKDRWPRITSWQRHLLQVSYTDFILGKFLTSLKEKGLYDRALIIITADHGISFRHLDQRRTPSDTNYSDIMSIPLFIKFPFQAQGKISDDNIETVDIFPTIAEVLGVDNPWEIHGNSTLSLNMEERKGKTLLLPEGNFSKFSKKFFPPNFSNEQNSTLKEKLHYFGAGSIDALHHYGKYEKLYRKDPRSFLLKENKSITCDLLKKFEPQYINPETDPLPGYLRGVIRSDTIPLNELQIGVALNNKLYAFTGLFNNNNKEGEFQIILPQEAFIKGTNTLRIFSIKNKNGIFSLEEIDIKFG
ncbi:sulfatase-like hydrolase/transferase [Bdellovibrionota bacterium]